MKLSTVEEIHLKCVVIDGSVVNGLRQPILYSYVSDKPPRYKSLCASETMQSFKTKKICLENENVFFRRE